MESDNPCIIPVHMFMRRLIDFDWMIVSLLLWWGSAESLFFLVGYMSKCGLYQTGFEEQL